MEGLTERTKRAHQAAAKTVVSRLRLALKNPLGKKSLRGIRSAAQDMRIHQADPHRPEPCAQIDLFYHLFRRRPSAANKIAQTHSALVHAHADIQHQKPCRDEHRNVTRHGAETLDFEFSL